MPAAVPIAIGLGTAAVVSGGAQAYFGYKGAHEAARAQRDAANIAAKAQTDMFNQTRADNQPWLDSGTNALKGMNEAFNRGDFSQQYGGSFDPNQYSMPTYQGGAAFDPKSVQMDPGFQFRMDQGNQALDRSASARGSVLGGGQKKAILNYSQGLASSEYGNAYNRTYGAYTDQRGFDYNRFLGDQSQANNNRDFGYNSFLNDRNLFYSNQNQAFNRYASMAGVGQATAQNMGQLRAGLGQQLGEDYIGAGNAQASGLVGGYNAISNGMKTGLNGVQNAFLLSQMGKAGGTT